MPQSPIEECDSVILTSTSLITDTQQSNPTDEFTEKSSAYQTITNLECLSTSANCNTKTVLVTSPSNNSDISLEQNDSIGQSNSSSSSSFLQTKQCRIDHRRNKSEPFRSASTEDLSSLKTLELSSTSTTSNDSPLSNDKIYHVKRNP